MYIGMDYILSVYVYRNCELVNIRRRGFVLLLVFIHHVDAKVYLALSQSFNVEVRSRVALVLALHIHIYTLHVQCMCVCMKHILKHVETTWFWIYMENSYQHHHTTHNRALIKFKHYTEFFCCKHFSIEYIHAYTLYIYIYAHIYLYINI